MEITAERRAMIAARGAEAKKAKQRRANAC